MDGKEELVSFIMGPHFSGRRAIIWDMLELLGSWGFSGDFFNGNHIMGEECLVKGCVPATLLSAVPLDKRGLILRMAQLLGEAQIERASVGTISGDRSLACWRLNKWWHVSLRLSLRLSLKLHISKTCKKIYYK
jgi:hypothetical protein